MTAAGRLATTALAAPARLARLTRLTRLARLAVPAVVALALGAAAVGCKGDDRAGDPAPAVEPMTQAEIDLGVSACEAYVARACACSRAQPDNADWQQSCDLAPGRVDALGMLFEVNRGESDDRERLLTHAKARKMIAACIRDTNGFEARGCPRAASSAPPAPAPDPGAAPAPQIPASDR